MIYLALSILIVGGIAVFFFGARAAYRAGLKKLLDLRLLLIKIPQNQGEKTDFREEINRSGQLFSALSGMSLPFVFEAAVHNVGEEIHFYLAVPSKSVNFAMRQIEGLFKDSQVEEVSDYNIFNFKGAVSGGYVKQKNSYALPIRTYEEANVDTFAPILNALTKIKNEGEGAAIQIIAAPAPKSVKKNIGQALLNVRNGESPEKIFGGSGGITVSDIAKAAGFGTAAKDAEKPASPNAEAAKAVEFKNSKPLLTVNFRVIASAPTLIEADSIIEGVAGSFSQFSAPMRNELEFKKEKNAKKIAFGFSFRKMDLSQAIFLNTAELSSLFHLPMLSSGVPKIKWLKNKEVAAPVRLPDKGIILGENIFRGEAKTVRLADEDRRRHLYVIGQTGTGKTTFAKNLLIQDIKEGKGAALIDPHGDFADSVLGFVPKERQDDVIVFDPSDIEKPLGLNMLEYDLSRPEEKTFIVNEMQSIFNRLFTVETMGPMFEQYMRNALLLLMEDMPNEPATLMEVPRVFTDETYRARKLERISNPSVIDFWTKEAVRAGGEAALTNMTPYVTSKFNNFTSNDYMRPIIGQPKSAINFRQAMDEGKILLVKLPKGKIGDINANLLGMIITGKLLMASLSRTDIPESERKDFYLYIDEFQNFTTDSIATILSEARKYRLNLTIAHQFIAQLTDNIREAVFGNVGSIVCFRVGVTDTETLAKQFEPVFGKQDLMGIDNFNAYVKLLINGESAAPFNLRVLPPEKGDENLAKNLKEASRSKYGKDRQIVESEIWERLRK